MVKDILDDNVEEFLESLNRESLWSKKLNANLKTTQVNTTKAVE
jgi:hypothetical protein